MDKSKEKFWLEIIGNKENHIIINDTCYFVGKKETFEKGYDGRKFVIKKNDGNIIETNNLRYNGEVPKEFRKELPNNAEFIW